MGSRCRKPGKTPGRISGGCGPLREWDPSFASQSCGILGKGVACNVLLWPAMKLAPLPQRHRRQHASNETLTVPVRVPREPRNEWDRVGLALLGGALLCFFVGTLKE